MAVEFVKPGSDEAKEINRILLKEVDKKRYTAKQICKMMQDEGFPKFDQEHHTNSGRSWERRIPPRGLVKSATTRALGFGLTAGSLAFERTAKNITTDTGSALY